MAAKWPPRSNSLLLDALQALLLGRRQLTTDREVSDEGLLWFGGLCIIVCGGRGGFRTHPAFGSRSTRDPSGGSRVAGSLEGRVAVVTGGGGGLAEGICTELAASGAAVAAVDRSLEKAERVAKLASANGARCIALEADVSDKASVQNMTQRVSSELGGIDILVNNAAIYPLRPWTEIEEEEWDRVMAVNLKGYFLCARAAYPSMRERGKGRIINVASITFFIGWSGFLDYVSSKGAIIGFTRTLAREVGPDGITVNAISPGAFPTDAERVHPDQEALNRRIIEQQALKRRGTPQDVGNLAAFLASDSASFITGQTIMIDGGWAMH
jgi:3-oxoacyl-[acyl-carrier protein] reductase